MKKFIFFLFLLPAFTANAQIGWEDFYSEKDLQSDLQYAKTPAEQLDATGCLAVHYKKIHTDSLAKVYIQKVFSIAENSKDVYLMARALWWDISYEGSVEKANKLLQYAEQHNLLKEKISANLSLVDINIHQNLTLAEKYALTAQNLLNQWKKDTIGKDSIKLEIYLRSAHTYIHKVDGVKTSRYLFLLQDYAVQNKNESLKIQAIDALETMYFEWGGQEKKAIPWLNKEYEYFKKTKQFNKLLGIVSALGMLYGKLGNKEQTKTYFNEFGKLQDS